MDLETFSNNSLGALTLLNVSLNNIGSLYMKSLEPLKELSYFIAQQNKLYNLTTSRLKNLFFLNLQKNRLFDFPQTCDLVTGESFFPNLKLLLLQNNMISSIKDPVCLPNLANLSLSFNRFLTFESNTFGNARFPRLEYLALIEMEDKIVGIERFAFNNSQLKFLGLALNYINLSSQTVLHDDAFGGCTGITAFYFDYCVFKAVSKKRFQILFHPFKKIQSWYLGYCQISSISHDTFSPFVNLESLYLHGNLMKFLPDGCFSALTKLKFLALNNNRISVISKNTFDEETRDRLQKIYLSGNPFYCSCDIRWFQEWLSSRQNPLVNYAQEGYMCDNILNTNVTFFQINDQACLLGQAAASFTIAVTIIVLFVFIISVTCFRYRWHLRLVMYEWFHHRGPQEGQLRHFTYDVFVGYAEEDRKWVLQELLPVVEGQWNLRACVHERDFIPGKHIVDNIADCVQDSRKILMVFSPDYARSEWCQFELKYCQCCVMDRDEVLVLVLLHETESRDMTSAMFAVMKTTTYIDGRTLLMLFICVCNSQGVHVDHCWVDTYNGEFMSPCFDEGRCRCNNITADCSSNNGSLTYVPRLPVEAQVFNFSNNNLSHIPDGFFSNVSQVWLLDLCQNGLTSLSPRAFQELQKLTTLLLNGNSLVYQALTPVFHVRSLKKLEILCNNLSSMDLETFSNNSLGELMLLNVSLNNIGSLYMKILEPLKGLRYFIAQQNKLYNLTTSRLKNLLFLDLQNNRLFDFPQTCDVVTDEPFFPNLKYLVLDQNMISSIKDPVCLPELLNLTLSFNRFLTFESNTFGNARFPRLENLELAQMEDKIVGIERFAFNNSQLKYLGLALNFINLSSQTVLHDDAFGGIISGDTFSPFVSLESLYLYGNLIRFLPDGCFSALTKLKVLVLNNNLISIISKGTFAQETLGRLQEIDLGGNPFYCSCDIRWFQEWMSLHPHQFGNYDQDGYMCDNILNTPVQFFQINDQEDTRHTYDFLTCEQQTGSEAVQDYCRRWSQ
ncbi:slit homolog 3 protein-like [Pomacea canaliculata]|uniref:slit homolog 3 protein-like n=1 Tax=Pomacea canaliculata TaxID=400727 RepID=UPI000D73FDC7|nr:slit homolog 3 protein-like [Pomacea canaliculata]